MLRELHIENYAIIEKLDIEFFEGLNIITGETGAGKSILLGAIGLLSGGRADSSTIRDGAQTLVAEATFDIEGYGLQSFFAANDLDYAPQITIRRTVNTAGKSRAFVDELPVTLGVLKELTERLIDIHSQHQTLLLGGSNLQTEIVDSVAGHLPVVTNYTALFRELTASKAALAKAEKASADAIRERDYTQHQLEQIEALNLRPGEQQELEEEQNTLSHAEEIVAALDYCAAATEGAGEEGGVNETLRQLVGTLARLSERYPAAEALRERTESVRLEMRDLASEFTSKRDIITIDPARLAAVNERLDAIYTLCQKHGLQEGNQLIELQRTLDERLQAMDNADERITALRKKIEALDAEATALAAAITAERLKAVPVIEKHVVDTLADLGISGAQFVVRITPLGGGESDGELGPSGADCIAMLFSGNAGMAPQPIEKVASGGEMSRVMLSLKELVARSVKLPTIIFDEIDAGVSGRVADRMGEIIVSMSETMQVLNITHLPQVAAKGSHHYHVYKTGGTEEGSGTHIRRLSADERVEHIATMLSGSNVTEAARAQAAVLLGKK